MTLIDTRPLVASIRREIAANVSALAADGVTATLAAVIATDDPATAWYLRSISKAAAEVGIAVREVSIEGDGSQISMRLDELSADPAVHGIISLTPLPDELTPAEVGEHIVRVKDVDGINPTSLGRLVAGLPAFAPATAQAVLEILRHEHVALVGAQAVVVGRSTIVGKPAALLLLAEHATVTVCHSRTRDLAAVTRQADVVVAAVGHAHLIGREHVKPGAVVIDVGTNAADGGSITGDVDTEAVEAVAAVTPVPGGVGPVTTSLLLRHVAAAALRTA